MKCSDHANGYAIDLYAIGVYRVCHQSLLLDLRVELCAQIRSTVYIYKCLLPSLKASWHLPSSTIVPASLRRQEDRRHLIYHHQDMPSILCIHCSFVKNATPCDAIAV